jgi:succinate dehydrogenase flavin-adding protein (antitoxin of CptAB toxin-antitoxin module)
MRELDLVLEAFLESHYDRLTPEAQADFEHLLAQSNQNLVDWLMAGVEPESEPLARIAIQIREVCVGTTRALLTP